MGYKACDIALEDGAIEDFKDNKIIIICRTKKESLNFLMICEKNGIKWSDGKNATFHNMFKRSQGSGLMYFHDHSMTYSRARNYKEGDLYWGEQRIKEFNNLIVGGNA